LNQEEKNTVRSFLLELAIYAGLVIVYFYLVLTFLGKWLDSLFLGRRRAYAAAALGLIIGQGVALETVTSVLLRLIRYNLRARGDR